MSATTDINELDLKGREVGEVLVIEMVDLRRLEFQLTSPHYGRGELIEPGEFMRVPIVVRTSFDPDRVAWYAEQMPMSLPDDATIRLGESLVYLDQTLWRWCHTGPIKAVYKKLL